MIITQYCPMILKTTMIFFYGMKTTQILEVNFNVKHLRSSKITQFSLVLSAGPGNGGGLDLDLCYVHWCATGIHQRICHRTVCQSTRYF